MVDIFKLIKKRFCCNCCNDNADPKEEWSGIPPTEDVKDESVKTLPLKSYADKQWSSWFNLGIEEVITENEDGSETTEFLVPEEKNRTPLTDIKVGDAVVFYEFWRDQYNKGLFIVESFDYGDGTMPGSAPRALYGRSAIVDPGETTATYYSDWTPGTGRYYEPTEDELEKFFAEEPIDSTLNSLYYFENYPSLMERYKKYKFEI